jgi:hypothetical protein
MIIQVALLACLLATSALAGIKVTGAPGNVIGEGGNTASSLGDGGNKLYLHDPGPPPHVDIKGVLPK